MVTINYGDSVKLAAFVDFVSQATGTTIIYGDELKGQTVMLRPAEVHVPKAQLLELLRGMLRMHELALVNADMEGWLRIVPTDDIQRHVSDIRSDPAGDPAAASQGVVTQVVQLDTDELPLVVKHLRSFLSSPKASVIEVPEKRILIITDYESAIVRAMGIVKRIAAAPPQAELVTIPVRHGDAKAIAERVLQVLQDKARLEERKEVRVTLQAAPDAGGVLALGMQRDLAQVRELIERFDVPADQRNTVAYAPVHISADRLRKLIESVIATDTPAITEQKSFLDEDTNRLYVTADVATHRRIEALLAGEDVLQQEASRPLRLYKPKHRRARDLIATLSEVLPNISTTPAAEDAPVLPSEGMRPTPPGPNRPPAEPGPGVAPPEPPAERKAEAARAVRPPRVKRIQGQDFSLSYDDHTNALIAVGSREFHAKLVTMLEELDRRQPQVLIEMTLVAITFNDSLSLAMELANEERLGDYQSLLFSSFGLSDIAIPSGVRTFHPGGGFNGVILGPNETPLLMRAIAAHGNSRIITTPKIVVADNSSATVSSVEEAPFTSINASDTVATTSFAGFESAGTTLTVTPQAMILA
ncbi:MAG: hypothetical protein HY763_09020, partial [Planctomycetes bacterium]|nr:hypothetical protein [Planctomycetota bacterium]